MNGKKDFLHLDPINIYPHSRVCTHMHTHSDGYNIKIKNKVNRLKIRQRIKLQVCNMACDSPKDLVPGFPPYHLSLVLVPLVFRFLNLPCSYVVRACSFLHL